MVFDFSGHSLLWNLDQNNSFSLSLSLSLSLALFSPFPLYSYLCYLVILGGIDVGWLNQYVRSPPCRYDKDFLHVLACSQCLSVAFAKRFRLFGKALLKHQHHDIADKEGVNPCVNCLSAAHNADVLKQLYQLQWILFIRDTLNKGHLY